jgi:hypothetical protein
MVADDRHVDSGLTNPTVNVRIVLAVLWICQFTLWFLGGIIALLQEIGEPTTDTPILGISGFLGSGMKRKVAFGPRDGGLVTMSSSGGRSDGVVEVTTVAHADRHLHGTFLPTFCDHGLGLTAPEFGISFHFS